MKHCDLESGLMQWTNSVTQLAQWKRQNSQTPSLFHSVARLTYKDQLQLQYYTLEHFDHKSGMYLVCYKIVRLFLQFS